MHFPLSYHVEKVPFPIAHLGKHEVLSSDRTDWCMVPVQAERWAGLKMILLCLGGDKNYLCLASNICWCSSRLRRGCDMMISKCCCLHWVCANFCWQHKGLCRLKNLSAKPCTTDSSVLAWSGFSGFAWCVLDAWAALHLVAFKSRRDVVYDVKKLGKRHEGTAISNAFSNANWKVVEKRECIGQSS